MRDDVFDKYRSIVTLVVLTYCLAIILMSCASTKGDPYGDGVPCYEGPLIVDKIGGGDGS